MLHVRRQRFADAEREARRALEIRRVALGDEHPETAITLATLANVLASQKRYDEAEALARAAQAALGAVDPVGALHARSLLARILLAHGRPAEALTELDGAIPDFAAAIGAEHVLVLGALVARASALAETGRREEARRELERLVPILERKGGEGLEALERAQATLRSLDAAPDSGE
jgi:tetratricopeptide (TPR) repeat protein